MCLSHEAEHHATGIVRHLQGLDDLERVYAGCIYLHVRAGSDIVDGQGASTQDYALLLQTAGTPDLSDMQSADCCPKFRAALCEACAVVSSSN